MLLDFLPTLGIHRELYSMPRGMERFRAYIARMTGGTAEIELPLTTLNPMGKEHLLRAVEAWIGCGAEEAAAQAVRESAARFSGEPGRLRVALVLADDVAGGWTNRWTTDFAHRFESAPLYRRDFAVGLLWASEAPSAAGAAAAVAQSVARAAYERAHGPARTLRDELAQERFAGAPLGPPPPARYLEAADAPTLFACLYGDEAARSLGYTPLGVDAALGR
jgi:hypothetical protein